MESNLDSTRGPALLRARTRVPEPMRPLFALALLLVAADVASAQEGRLGRILAELDLDAELALASAYESNITHRQEPTPSVGLVPEASVRVRSRVAGAKVEARYEVARHGYTNTDRWDRTSQEVRLRVDTEPSNALSARTEARFSAGGASDERKVGNDFRLVQELGWEPRDDRELRVFGTLRYLAIPEDPDDNAYKPNVGAVFVQSWPDGTEFEAEVRADANLESGTRGDYLGTALSAGLRVPLSDVLGDLRVEARRRAKHYTGRLAEDEEGDELSLMRRDTQVRYRVGWGYEASSRLTLDLLAEFERRASNDASKGYQATALWVRTTYGF